MRRYITIAVLVLACIITGVALAYDDTKIGTSNNDSLTGGCGSSWVLGFAGNDVLNGDVTDGTCGAGDRIEGGGGSDYIYGRAWHDQQTLYAVGPGAGSDAGVSSSDRDQIYGGSGSDILAAANQQADYLNGGPDYDICWYDQRDTVVSCEELHYQPQARVAQ